MKYQICVSLTFRDGPLLEGRTLQRVYCDTNFRTLQDKVCNYLGQVLADPLIKAQVLHCRVSGKPTNDFWKRNTCLRTRETYRIDLEMLQTTVYQKLHALEVTQTSHFRAPLVKNYTIVR